MEMSEYEMAMLTKVLVGAGVLFIVALIGNMLTFSNKFVNALVTAIIFAAIYAGLYFMIDRALLPEDVRNISQEEWLQIVGMSAVLVFVIDLIANMLSFSNRFISALVTAIVFAVVFGGLMYATGGVPADIPA